MPPFGQPEPAPVPRVRPVLMLDGPRQGQIHILPVNCEKLHDIESYLLTRPEGSTLPDACFTALRQVTYFFAEVTMAGRQFRVGVLGHEGEPASQAQVNEAAWRLLASALAKQAADLTESMR